MITMTQYSNSTQTFARFYYSSLSSVRKVTIEYSFFVLKSIEIKQTSYTVRRSMKQINKGEGTAEVTGKDLLKYTIFSVCGMA